MGIDDFLKDDLDKIEAKHYEQHEIDIPIYCPQCYYQYTKSQDGAYCKQCTK